MDEQDRSWPASFGTIWPTIAILAAAVFGVVLYKPPLESARPPTPLADANKPPSSLGMNAQYSRLWEDPLDFAETSPQQSTGSLVLDLARSYADARQEQKESKNVQRVVADILRNAKVATDGSPNGTRSPQDGSRPAAALHVIPVLLPGGPYAMEHEVRMRMRSAVFHGLTANDFSLAMPKRMSSVKVPIVAFLRATNEYRLVKLRLPIKIVLNFTECLGRLCFPSDVKQGIRAGRSDDADTYLLARCLRWEHGFRGTAVR